MKIKEAPIGSTVTQNGTKAIVLSFGSMGCRVNVISGDPDSTNLGKQIWSNETIISQWIGVDPASDKGDKTIIHPSKAN